MCTTALSNSACSNCCEPSCCVPRDLRNERQMSDVGQVHDAERRQPSLLRSGTVTGIAQASRAMMELCGTLVLARLLAPEAFGLVGMVISFVVFARLFQDAGLSAATIQRQTLDDRQISTLFWLNLAASVVIAGVFASLAPVIAWFFDEPKLVAITLIAALAFPLQGASIQHVALLKRHLRFERLAWLETGATAAGWSLAIIAAFSGWDYWSLLVRLLVDASIVLLLSLLLGNFRPRFEFSWKAAAPLVHFAKYVTGFNLVNTLARNLDDILIGRVWGAHDLGLYQRAYQLLMLPLSNVNAPIGKIAVPTLSRQLEDENRYKKTFRSLLRTVLLMTLPLGGYLSAVSEPLVVLCLGEPWRGAADIFPALSLLLLTQPLANATGWLFISQGRSKDMLHWGLVGAGLSVLSFVAGLPYGAVGVAWA